MKLRVYIPNTIDEIEAKLDKVMRELRLYNDTNNMSNIHYELLKDAKNLAIKLICEADND